MNTEEFYDSMRVFGEPKIPDGADRDAFLEAIMKSYDKALSRYGEEDLNLASENMHRVRRHRNFPLLAECLEFCRNAEEERLVRLQREAEKGLKTENKHSADPWSGYRVKKADRMMDSDIGRRAAQEGWIIALHDFCREQERLPSQHEATRVRLEALANKAIRDRLAEHPNYRQGMAMIAHATRGMENKRNRLTAIALKDRG